MGPGAALAGVTLFAALHAWWRAFLIDDAYISFRYARHLVDGHGLVFNVGERTEGYTNFLWTLLVAGAMRLGCDPGDTAQILGILCAVTTLLVVHRFARDLGAGRWGSILPPAMLAVNRSFAAWATSGLETRLFTLLIVAAAWRLFVERRRLRDAGAVFPVSGMLVAAACLTRPEGYLALAVALAGVAIGALRMSGGRRYLLGWAAAAAALPLTHLLWRHGYYGEWVPNSFHAKVPGLRLESGWIYLRAFAGVHLWPVAAALAAIGGAAAARRPGRPPARRDAALAVFVLPFAALYLLYVAAIGGDHFEFRFVDPVLVLLYLASAVTGLSAVRATRPWAAVSLAGALIAVASWSSLVPFRDLDVRETGPRGTTYVSISSVETEAEYFRRWAAIGKWLAAHAGPGESIAVRPAGAIPYFSGLRTLDMLGINDRDIARLPARPGENVGHEKQVEADYVAARGITYLIGSPEIRLDRAARVSPNAVEVPLDGFWWYFWPLQPGARIR